MRAVMKAFLVTGSRDWDNQIVIYDQLISRYERGLHHLLIHGAAKGADRIAGRIAAAHNWSVVPMPAQWEMVGITAGKSRNKHMLEVLKHLSLCGYECQVLAFPLPGSKGTWHMVKIARAAGFDVWVYGEEL